MANKYLVFDLKEGGFLGTDDSELGIGTVGTGFEHAAVYSDRVMESIELNPHDTARYLQVPLTKELVESFPFDLTDMDPGMPYGEPDRNAALAGDFIVLTDMGFYDEKYNSQTNTSRPKVRGFELDYANLYDAKTLERLGTEYITTAEAGSPEPVIVPVAKEQQEALKLLPEFSPTKEPHGFFMEPIGETMAKESSGLEELGAAVEKLSAEQAEEAGLPFNP